MFTALCLSWTGAALAQSADEIAGARAVATEGAKAFEEGRYADAIDLMMRADSLVKSPVHQLYVARSYAKIGKLVQARELFLKIRREGASPDSSEAVRRAVGQAEKELQQIEPRLPYISVVVQGAGPLPVTVTMDGIAVPQALIGVPRPVDPGEHVFQAYAEGKHSPEKKVEVKEGVRETVILILEEGRAQVAAAPQQPEPAPVGPTTTGPTQPPPGQTGSVAPPPPADSGGTSGMRIASYAAFGVGVVGLGAGGYFLWQASDKRSQADALCTLPGGQCPPENRDAISDLDSQAGSAGTIGAVGIAIGGVGIATGITLFVLSSGSSGSASAPALMVSAAPGRLAVSGRF